MEMIKIFFSTLLFGLILDMLWLGVIAKNIYLDQIGSLMRKMNGAFAPNWAAGIGVYMAIIIGILFFVLPKAEGNFYDGFMWGALLGAIIYGVYDFTNLAILANWPLKISIIDFIWGSFFCGMLSLVAMSVQHWLRN